MVVRVRRRKLYEEVAEELERLIQDGDYAPADQLPSERDLMRQFGVGRPAIREALFHLGKMGLIELRSGERARVTRPTPQVVIGALVGTRAPHARLARRHQRFPGRRECSSRPGLARHAAEHATKDDLARFEAKLEENRQSIGDLAALPAHRRGVPLRAGADPAEPDLHRHP